MTHLETLEKFKEAKTNQAKVKLSFEIIIKKILENFAGHEELFEDPEDEPEINLATRIHNFLENIDVMCHDQEYTKFKLATFLFLRDLDEWSFIITAETSDCLNTWLSTELSFKEFKKKNAGAEFKLSFSDKNSGSSPPYNIRSQWIKKHMSEKLYP